MTRLFDESQQKLHAEHGLDPDKIPYHIAVIMDGNGRWAKKRLMPRNMGHNAGSEALRKAIKACANLGVKALSAYAFSTENWRRPEKEVSFLMGFFKLLIEREIPKLNKEKVRVRFIGDFTKLDPELVKHIRSAEERTAHNEKLELNLMINYGSRQEITHAAQVAAEKLRSGEITEITEETFANCLYTAPTPDPDMLIRTGGNNIRLSNYLLWQCAYTEFFFLDILWPDFTQDHLISTILEFQNRLRNFGGLVS